MRKFVLFALLALAAAFASPAFADSIARQGNDWVRITARPCSDEKVLLHIAAANPDPNAHLDYRAATAFFQGLMYTACWKLDGKNIALVYEDGDKGEVPHSDLKPDKDSI